MNASFSHQLPNIFEHEATGTAFVKVSTSGASKFSSTVIPWRCNEDVRVAKSDGRGNGETQRCGFAPTSVGSQRYCTPRIVTPIVQPEINGVLGAFRFFLFFFWNKI